MPLIQALEPHQFPTLIALAQAIWQPTYGAILSEKQLQFMFDATYTHAALQAQITDGQQFFLLYNDENEAIGYAAWSYWHFGGARQAKLNKIYLHPNAQDKGLGLFLLQKIEEKVAQETDALQLCVNRYNKALRFYERAGYRIIAEADFPFGDYLMNDFVLQKELV